MRAKILLMLAGTLAGRLLAEAAVRVLGLRPPAPRRVGPEIELDGAHRRVPGISFAGRLRQMAASSGARFTVLALPELLRRVAHAIAARELQREIEVSLAAASGAAP